MSFNGQSSITIAHDREERKVRPIHVPRTIRFELTLFLRLRQQHSTPSASLSATSPLSDTRLRFEFLVSPVLPCAMPATSVSLSKFSRLMCKLFPMLFSKFLPLNGSVTNLSAIKVFKISRKNEQITQTFIVRQVNIIRHRFLIVSPLLLKHLTNSHNVN